MTGGRFFCMFTIHFLIKNISLRQSAQDSWQLKGCKANTKH